MSQAIRGALSGLRVIEATHALAGPFCGQILADHGADVIKIEPPEGDFFRRVGPYDAEDKERHFGGLFQSCNRNKRSIAIDIKKPEGRELFKELIAGADAFVENYRADVLNRLGLGYEDLRKINPRLVYTSVRGFGDRAGGASPYMNWPTFDIVAQAFGGWMGITGPSTDEPYKVGGGAGDTVPGLFAAFGTLAAMFNARQTGQGQYVDVAMVDSILAMGEMLASTYAYTGVSAQPIGNSLPGLAPFGTVPAKDGVVVIAAAHDPQWRELSAIMGKPELATDPRYVNEPQRWANRAEMMAEIEAFTRQYTKQELKELLGGRVPMGPIYSGEDIFREPHFEVRGMLPEVDHPGMQRKVKVLGVPVKLSGTPGGVRHRAPILGEHTEAVLHEFGFSQTRIDELVGAGVVRRATAD